MKIIFRISYMGFGGAEQVFLSIAREIRKHHQILFVTDRADGSSYQTLLDENFDIISLNVKRTILSVGAFKNVIDEFRPNIVLSAYPDTNAAAILSTMLSKVKPKIIVSEHASIVEHFKDKSLFTRLKVNLIVRLLYPFADHIISVSEGVMNDVVKLVKKADKCSFIHNPVRFKATAEGAQQSASPVLLAVGRVTPQKDYMTLLKAMQIVRKTIPGVQLNIVGGIHNRAEMKKLEQYVLDNDLSGQVKFVGFSDKVQDFYTASTLFVLSSAWEGFGNVIVEALAFGLPVVSTDCKSGPAEILGGGRWGRLVPVGDEQQLATAILNEISSPVCSREFRLNRASDFTEKVVAQKYLNLFQSLLN